MAKRIIFAVAGSGKTTKILNSINLGQRTLILTYTNENLKSLERKIVEKYGRIPEHICLVSYFSFLYTFCFRPIFSYKLRDNSYTWKIPDIFPPKTNPSHYMTSARYLYANRVAKYLIEKDGMSKVVPRLEKYFDCVFIDEIQDFAGNDFNFLMEISKADVDFLLVGDFYQHTFDTSRDGNIRKNLHSKGVTPYLKEFKNAGFEVDTVSLEKTYRCSQSVCVFIKEKLGIEIASFRTEDTNVFIIENESEAEALFNDNSKVKLFYQNHLKYDCYSNNWGKSKGLDNYNDVCVVLNQTTAKLFREDKLDQLAEPTRNRLYVACSRTKGDLYFLLENHLKKFKSDR